MNEVKNPKKPLIFYYGIVLLVLMLFNFLAIPWMAQRQIREVDYGTFMQMTEDRNIGRVEVQDNQILFTDKEETLVYKTGVMNDPELILADEPTGNLDEASGRMVMELLTGLQKELHKTLVLVTHDKEIAGYCDRTVVIRDGRIEKDRVH